MMDLFKKYPVAVILSVVFHLLLVAFFMFSADIFSEKKINPKPTVNVVKATVIDESKIKAEAEKLKNIENKKRLQEQARLNEIKKKRLAEEKRIADLKKQQELQKQKLAKQKADEAARQAKLKEKNLLAKKKAEAAEKKKQADEKKKRERLAREKAEKLKAAKEKAAKEKAAKEQAQREQALRELAAQEEQEIRAQEAVASYTDLIRQKVERNWIQPPGDITGLDCVVRVRLIPGGDVIDAQVIKSSGNALFDRSVERATRKAAPLPLPNDPKMFNFFRTLEFYFRPGD
ncbi:cell envelope integrity protein TolA [Cycloclasticus pugetii]|jgi:colicin import membrane protein|uniref:cell envelope integrity protein TolA n=1 Tax=Cycloclasticus pugetii TaxID=34068 RepID=UPI002166BAF1|nr:cell envelope integrity protein TolA [Cycloclasticus pugetii]